MKKARLLVALCTIAAVGGGCNQSNPKAASPASPTPISTTVVPSTPAAAVYSLEIQPKAVFDAGAIAGTVVLTFPAPAGGLAVSLSSSDQTLLALPATVTVPAGGDRVSFSGMALRSVTTDISATVTATAGGRSATATLTAWAILPTFLSLFSDTGDYIGSGGLRRLLPPYPTFVARCSGNTASFEFWDNSGNWWYAHFQAPAGSPLRVGTYEGATRYPFQASTQPGLDISGEGRGCNMLSGQFSILEADITASGQILRFWATFEQHCENKTPALRGALRVSNGPAVSGSCLR